MFYSPTNKYSLFPKSHKVQILKHPCVLIREMVYPFSSNGNLPWAVVQTQGRAEEEKEPFAIAARSRVIKIQDFSPELGFSNVDFLECLIGSYPKLHRSTKPIIPLAVWMVSWFLWTKEYSSVTALWCSLIALTTVFFSFNPFIIFSY